MNLSLANPIIFDRIRAARLSRHGRKTKSLPGAGCPIHARFAHKREIARSTIRLAQGHGFSRAATVSKEKRL
jgi:hypothetical protein